MHPRWIVFFPVWLNNWDAARKQTSTKMVPIPLLIICIVVCVGAF